MILLLSVLLVSSFLYASLQTVSVNALQTTYHGLSGFTLTQESLQQTVDEILERNFNIYRISFSPSWRASECNLHAYDSTYIDYLLANTNLFIIVDGNHLNPPSEATSQEARDHWDEVQNPIFTILQAYPNNQRVAVELINEYVSGDYDARIQNFINIIRDSGYTNPIVTNKWTTVWTKFNDPLNNTYQGMHFYFNTWTPDGAMNQMAIAQSRGITKILNTEVGASFNENKAYNQAMVDCVNQFISQSQALSVSNCIWMNNDVENLQTYIQYGYLLPPASSPNPLPHPSTQLIPQTTAPILTHNSSQTSPTPTATPNSMSTATPKPPSPTQTPIPSPEPSPTPTIDELIKVYTNAGLQSYCFLHGDLHFKVSGHGTYTLTVEIDKKLLPTLENLDLYINNGEYYFSYNCNGDTWIVRCLFRI